MFLLWKCLGLSGPYYGVSRSKLRSENQSLTQTAKTFPCLCSFEKRSANWIPLYSNSGSNKNVGFLATLASLQGTRIAVFGGTQIERKEMSSPSNSSFFLTKTVPFKPIWNPCLRIMSIPIIQCSLMSSAIMNYPSKFNWPNLTSALNIERLKNINMYNAKCRSCILMGDFLIENRPKLEDFLL